MVIILKKMNQIKLQYFINSRNGTHFVSSLTTGMNLTQSRFWKFASIQLRGACCRQGRRQTSRSPKLRRNIGAKGKRKRRQNNN